MQARSRVVARGEAAEKLPVESLLKEALCS
jgi:hypothetical protein